MKIELKQAIPTITHLKINSKESGKQESITNPLLWGNGEHRAEKEPAGRSRKEGEHVERVGGNWEEMRETKKQTGRGCKGGKGKRGWEQEAKAV